MSKPKKIINDPKQVVPELLEGLVLAYNGSVKALDGCPSALVKTTLQPDRVALLVGGGSGHEPLFHGFIGENMADGAACGNIFAAPSPDIILEATKAVHRGKGVIYLYGNYAGDNMNFDIAAEMAEDEGIDVKTVRVWDDVASAPADRFEDRRGIAGDLPLIKLGGGIVAKVNDLSEATALLTRARDNTRSIGVALSAGSIPETGEYTFTLPEDELEIGMGVHGEAGVSREKLIPADEVADKMVAELLKEGIFNSGDSVVLLINNLGSTTMMECLIVNRRVRKILQDKGIEVYDSDVGSYVTCQEMAGCSITLTKLDDELKKFWDLPSSSYGYKKGARS